MWRLLAGLVLGSWVSGCCEAPTDPHEPAGSEPAESAGKFLEAIAAREDEDAWAMMAPGARGTLEAFSQRLDKFSALRDPEEIRWTRVHYVTGSGPEPTRTLERCLGLVTPSVEVDGVVVPAKGEETGVRLVGSRGGERWLWKEIRLDGKAVMPPPRLAKNSVGKPTPPSRARPGASQNEAQPAIARPEDPVSGRWRIREYVVKLTQPRDAWLQSYDASFGLTLGLGDPGPFGRSDSALFLRTNCEGLCRPAQFEETIRGKAAQHVLEIAARDADEAEWVQPPTKISDGTWWMHARATNEAGVTVAERVRFAFMSPQSDRGWLECVVDVRGAHLGRVEELQKWCRDLAWSYDGSPTGPAEPRFDGGYTIAGVMFEVPIPPGFDLAKYSPAEGEVEFRGAKNNLDNLLIKTGCDGACSPDKLEANLRKNALEQLEGLSQEGEAAVQEVPFEAASPRRFRSRVRSTAFDEPKLQIKVTAIPEGANRFVQCTVQLYGESVARGDELEKICTGVLSAY